MKFPRPGTRPLQPLVVVTSAPPPVAFTRVGHEAVWWQLLHAARHQPRPSRALREAITIILEGSKMKRRKRKAGAPIAYKSRRRQRRNAPPPDAPFLPVNQPRKAPNTSLSRKGWVK